MTAQSEAAVNHQTKKGAMAIAAVLDIAMHSDGRPVSAKALAERHGWAPRHLEPTLQALVHAGLLRGIRGPRGGYAIARDLRDITAEEIIRIAATAEPDRSWSGKSPLLANVIFPIIAQADRAYADTLVRVSLEDLVRLAGSML
jgi:Rrf2 family protein